MRSPAQIVAAQPGAVRDLMPTSRHRPPPPRDWVLYAQIALVIALTLAALVFVR